MKKSFIGYADSMKTELYTSLRDKITAIVPEVAQQPCNHYSRGDDAGCPMAVDIHYRDVTLADCLIVIKDAVMFRSNNECERNAILNLLMPTYKGGFRQCNQLWNLALPLHEQSDGLGEWLMTIIGEVKE